MARNLKRLWMSPLKATVFIHVHGAFGPLSCQLPLNSPSHDWGCVARSEVPWKESRARNPMAKAAASGVETRAFPPGVGEYLILPPF